MSELQDLIDSFWRILRAFVSTAITLVKVNHFSNMFKVFS